MKSTTSPVPSSVMNRVMSTAVSGKYSCFPAPVNPAGRMRQNPPRSRSSNDANIDGESNRGQQNQSTVPSVDTSAVV